MAASGTRFDTGFTGSSPFGTQIEREPDAASWIESNAAMLFKPPKVTMRPTLPFDDDEMTPILAAAGSLATWGSFRPKVKALVLLRRNSGRRMQDAACLERSRAADGLCSARMSRGVADHAIFVVQPVEE